MYLQSCGSFRSANHKKDWIRKSQIRKMSHLGKVRKSNKSFQLANVGFAKLTAGVAIRCGF